MYYDMTELLKPKKINNYCLEYFSITDIDESICHGIPFNKKFIRLIDENEKFNRCIMSNTPMEEYTNREFVEKAHGDILIAGLGIGMIILPLQDKEAVKSITIIEKNKDIWIEISGDGFLYNMVRIIAGTLVETGLGMRRPEDMAGTIESKNRSRAGHRAPAEGLYLVEVYYE